MARNIRTLAQRTALSAAGVALAAGASITATGVAHADGSGGGCGGPAWESACVSTDGAAIHSDAYTNFQTVNQGCVVDVILRDDTGNQQVFSSSYGCQPGPQHFNTVVLANPSQGHDYRTELRIHWTGGAAYDSQTSPQLQFGGRQPAPGVDISVDTSRASDLAGWAANEKTTLEQWYQPTVDLIDGGDYRAPTSYRIVFDPNYNGIAATSGGVVTVNPDWVRNHPDDTGFLIHEQVHIIQDGNNLPGYFTEGTADWVRYYRYQPNGVGKPAQSAGYRGSYGTTAYFLDYVATHYDANIVQELNDAGHDRTYTNDDDWFVRHTGRTAQQLWDSMYQQ